tara:strand:- start:221 stop:742 length:522 start_codon:yes stop_codon:yes gene_type:complete
MKKIFLFIVTIFFIIISNANSEQKVSFIDMDRVISTSKPGTSLLKQLNDLNNKNLTFLKKEEEKFKKKEEKLISQKNIISEDDFMNKVNILKSEIKNYNENRKKIITDFNKMKVTSTNNLLNLINPILIKFSNDKQISIILNKKDLVMGKTELDITDQIIEIVNTKVKSFMIK